LPYLDLDNPYYGAKDEALEQQKREIEKIKIEKDIEKEQALERIKELEMKIQLLTIDVEISKLNDELRNHSLAHHPWERLTGDIYHESPVEIEDEPARIKSKIAELYKKKDELLEE